MMHWGILLICWLGTLHSFSISMQPIAEALHLSESVSGKEAPFLFFGKKARQSTCTGVAWLPGDEALISAHFFEGTLSLHHFDRENFSIDSFPVPLDFPLKKPENLVITQNGKYLVIGNHDSGDILFFSLPLISSGGQNAPIGSLKTPRAGKIHGIRFSPDERYLVATSLTSPFSLLVYRSVSDEELQFSLCQRFLVDMQGLSPKAVEFSLDGRFLAVAYTCQARKQPGPLRSCIAIYRFDTDAGTIDPVPVDISFDLIRVPDDLRFYKDGVSLVIPSQGGDTLVLHRIDPFTGRFVEKRVLVEGEESGLSFPHGLCFSWDYRYLAVSNYGGNRVLIYEVFDRQCE